MAKTIDTLAVKIIADATDLEGGLGKVTKEVKEAARIVESLASPMDKLASKEARLNELFGQGAISQRAYGESLGRLRARMDELSAVRQPAALNFGSLASQIPVFGQLFTSVTSAAGAIAALRTGFHALESVSIDAGKRIDDVSDQADRLGLTVGGLSELKIAASFADVKDFESVNKAMEKMLVSVSKASSAEGDLDEETKKAANAFQTLRLNANDLIGLAPDQMFSRIAKELAEVPTNAQRAEIIKDIFGKGGNELKNLIEHLDEFKNKANSTGAVITQDQADAIERADEAMKQLKFAVEGLGNAFATIAAPALTKFTKELSWFLSQDADTIIQRIAAMAGSKGDQAALDAKARRNIVKPTLRAQILTGDFYDEATKTKAQMEKEAREAAGATEAQKQANLEKADAARLKAEAKSEAAIAKDFDSTSMALEREITILRSGKDAWEEMEAALKGFNDEQRTELGLRREERAALEAATHAKEQDLKLARERTTEAEKFRESVRSDKQIAADRVARAMDLVVTKELNQGDVEKLLRSEAGKLVKAEPERQLKTAAFGSQEAIAAIANRNRDSDKFDAMVELLRRIAEKEPVEVEEVSLSGA